MRASDEKIRLLPGESFRLLRWTSNLLDVETVAADGTCRPLAGAGRQWHHHGQLELTLFTEGSGTRFIGDSISHFTAPDLVLIGPDLPHYWHLRERSSGYALQFDFGPDHPFWRFPETQPLLDLWSVAQRGIHVTGRAADALADLIREAFGCGGMGRLACLMRILDTLSAAPPDERRAISGATFVPPVRQATYQSLQRAINRVFSGFAEPLRFSDVLSESHMSKATFERHFKRHTGKTFTQFVTEVRLNFASRQLIETDLPVSEIALASGYNNLSHFNHQFKALHRHAPRAFRRRMQQEAKAQKSPSGASPTRNAEAVSPATPAARSGGRRRGQK